MTADTALSTLMRLVARERDPARLMASLHQAACEITRASASVLLRSDPLGGGWTATSASGLETLARDAWLEGTAAVAAAGRAFASDTPVLIDDLPAADPELARRLPDCSTALLLPLLGGWRHPGLLILAYRATATAPDPGRAEAVADAFALALERAAERDDRVLAADLRGLLHTLAREGVSPAALGPALDGFCRSLARMTAAGRVRIWIHDREARELVAAADSEPADAIIPTAIPTSDLLSPIAAALRHDGAELLPPDAADSAFRVVVGLRGRRRALGVLALEGLDVDARGGLTLLARGEEIGRQLSSVLETVQLLEQVVRSRAELRTVADSHAELERRLAQSEKLLALGQFVAGVAHELSNPLQGVLGHLELMRASRRLPRPLARDVATAYREAGRAARIVRDLLVFAGSGKLNRRKVSINRLAARVLRLRTESLAAARIEVTSELDDRAAAIWADGLLIEQALLNLVVNAEQALGGPGRLTVRTEPADPDGVRLIVSDDGPGMSEDVRLRLFEPFFTTRGESGGTGLGLAIVYGIVTAHGGLIDVSSSPGAGASFTITLPESAPVGKD